MEGRTQDKKDSTINTFHWFFFFQARTRKSQFIEKCDPFLLIWFLSISFCNKAMSVQGRTAFTAPVHINPSSPTHVGFHDGFPWNCTREALRVI